MRNNSERMVSMNILQIKQVQRIWLRSHLVIGLFNCRTTSRARKDRYTLFSYSYPIYKDHLIEFKLIPICGNKECILPQHVVITSDKYVGERNCSYLHTRVLQAMNMYKVPIRESNLSKIAKRLRSIGPIGTRQGGQINQVVQNIKKECL